MKVNENEKIVSVVAVEKEEEAEDASEETVAQEVTEE